MSIDEKALRIATTTYMDTTSAWSGTGVTWEENGGEQDLAATRGIIEAYEAAKTDQPVEAPHDRGFFIRKIAEARDVKREVESLMITTMQAVDALMPYLMRESSDEETSDYIRGFRDGKNFAQLK